MECCLAGTLIRDPEPWVLIGAGHAGILYLASTRIPSSEGKQVFIINHGAQRPGAASEPFFPGNWWEPSPSLSFLMPAQGENSLRPATWSLYSF